MKFSVHLLFLLTACASAPKEQDLLLEKLTTLEEKVDELNDELRKKDSLSMELPDAEKAPTASVQKEEKKAIAPPAPSTKWEEKNIPVKEKIQVEKPVIDTDKEKISYYKNGKKSVVVSPWKDGKRTTTLFDPWEKQTYQLEETRSSYSVIAEVIAFHDNGAVAEIKVDTHPDASMYWYETKYTFGINNEPEWMYSTQYPQTQLVMPGDNAYYWNKKTGAWVKQEMAIETIVPPHR
jgi:hypothetical protein